LGLLTFLLTKIGFIMVMQNILHVHGTFKCDSSSV